MTPAIAIQPPKMPPQTQPQKDWKLSVILGLIGFGGVGGVPYISELQTKLTQTRESLIRLEEQTHSQQKAIEEMQKTLEAIRNRLEAKGIVNRIALDGSTVAGETHIERK